MKRKWIVLAVLAGLAGSLMPSISVKAYNIYNSQQISYVNVKQDWAPREIYDTDGNHIPVNKISLHSSDPHIASIKDSGVYEYVHCKRPGKVVITVTYQEAQTKVPLTVRYAIDNFKITENMHLLIGQSATIGIQKLAKNKIILSSYTVSMNWFSSNSSIVQVDSKGMINAMSEGEATITAIGKFDNNKSITRTCKVVVSGAEAPGIKAIKDNGHGLELAWTSGNKAVMYYTLSRKPAKKKGNTYSVIYSGNETTFLDSTVEAGKQYKYKLTYHALINGRQADSAPATKKAIFYGPAPSKLKILKKENKKLDGNDYIYIY